MKVCFGYTKQYQCIAREGSSLPFLKGKAYEKNNTCGTVLHSFGGMLRNFCSHSLWRSRNTSDLCGLSYCALSAAKIRPVLIHSLYCFGGVRTSGIFLLRRRNRSSFRSHRWVCIWIYIYHPALRLATKCRIQGKIVMGSFGDNTLPHIRHPLVFSCYKHPLSFRRFGLFGTLFNKGYYVADAKCIYCRSHKTTFLKNK